MELNKIYCCDNLELMRKIPNNSIDLIYSDILYGTGRKFKDYQDLKATPEDIKAHYIPRIKEMHRILKDTGSIYLQMDSRINHWIRCIMDSIFGYRYFRNDIKWVRSRGTNTESRFSEVLDSIIFYTKSDYYTFNPQYKSLSEGSLKRYNKMDEYGETYMEQTIQTKKNFKFEGDVRVFNGENFTNKEGLGWDWTQKELDKKINEGTKIDSNRGLLTYRRYLNKSKGSQINNLWDDLSTVTITVDKYDTQKPNNLLERIILSSSNEGDTVADFYNGSGTTTCVSEKLKRNFIACDINQNAVDIANGRLQ